MCGVATSLPWPPQNPAKPSETSHSASKRWGGIFDLPGLRHEVERLDSVTAEPGFWDDNEKAQKTLRDRAATQAKIDKFQKLSAEIKELGELFDPIRTTAMHGWHVEHGALFEDVCEGEVGGAESVDVRAVEGNPGGG